MNRVADVGELPGSELVIRGLADLTAGRDSPESLVLQIARRRLGELGVALPGEAGVEAAELRLYALLCESETPDPYSAYNALIRRLDKLLRALERTTRHEI